MGAEDFITTARGETAQDAFDTAVEDARYEHGHGGYTGTIAEKPGFKVEVPPVGCDPKDHVDALERSGSHWAYADKRGPAGAIEISPNQWTFFGMASS